MIDDWITARLLRRDIRRRADRQPRLRQCRTRRRARGGERLRDAEVGDHRRAARQQHVVRLDVAMHDAPLVRERQGARDVAQNAHRLGDRVRATRHEPRPETLAFDKRHRVVRHAVDLTRGQERNDVRLLK